MPIQQGQDNGQNTGHGVEDTPIRFEAHQKRWVKKYRTEIAASTSSVLSTFSAVWTNVNIPIAVLSTNDVS